VQVIGGVDDDLLDIRQPRHQVDVLIGESDNFFTYALVLTTTSAEILGSKQQTPSLHHHQTG
jgi:hypothetical protein